MAKFSGFLVDYVEGKDRVATQGLVHRIANAARARGATTKSKLYPNSGGSYRLWVDNASVDVLNAALWPLCGCSQCAENTVDTKPVTPTNTGPPVEDALLTLRKVVSTLNAVVEQLEAARAINNALRNEIARLSAKARSAMVVYGD